MNVVMDWGILNINVPRDEMLLIQTVPSEIRQLDLSEFKAAMIDKQDDDVGMAYLDMYLRNPPVNVSGVVLAQVVEIINGYTVTFEDGLYNVNIVGGNSNVAAVTVKNQVGVNTANSAGLQDSTSLQAASFQGHVTVDNNNGVTGTVFPVGTNRYPCLTIQSAMEIANREGIDEIFFKSPYGLGIGDDVSGFYLRGVSHAIAKIVIDPGAICNNTIFTNFEISGTLDDDCEIHESLINDLLYFNGDISDSIFSGVITLNGNKDASFRNCSMADINTIPKINVGGTGQDLIMINWTGIIQIENLTGDSSVGIGCDAGVIRIDETCVSGKISISGVGSIEDNSSNSCYVANTLVDGTGLMNITTVVEQLRPHHTGTGNIIYWNPYDGNDAWDGNHPDRAYKTFAKSHDMAGNANHDTIMIVPGDPTGVTTITEAINVTKDYLFIRGPGRDVIVYHDSSSAIPISLTTNARGTEFSGFRIKNEVINGYGIHSNGDFTLCANLWFEGCANGALFENHHPLIHSCKVHGATGFAIKMEGAISHGEIYDCTAGDAGETTIQINTTADTGGIKMRDTIVVGSAGYGVSLSATTRKFISESGNVVKYNALGNFNDLGFENVLNVEGSSTGGLDEDALHDGLDTYTSKDDWKADVSHLKKSIYVDTDESTNGNGSQGNPFNNVNDAKDLAEATGIKDIYVSGDITVPGNLKGMNVHGVGLPRIDFNGQDIKNSSFYGCSLSGTYSDSVIAENCHLEDGFLLSGHFLKCELGGNMSVSSTNEVTLISCLGGLHSGISNSITMNSGVASTVLATGYSGELTIKSSDNVSDIVIINMAEGKLEFDSTCTNGTLTARGGCKFIDNTNGAIVINETTAENVWTNNTRELTVSTGMTPEQEAKLDEIIVDINEIPALVLDEVAP